MPDQSSPIRLGKTAKQNLSKRFIDRYRWTEAEKLQALSELNSDPTIGGTPRISRALAPAEAFAGRPSYFGKPGLYNFGFPALDRLTLGFNPGDYIVLGAGTNQGKTQIATYIALANAKQDIPTLYISRELSSEEMANRFEYVNGADLPPALIMPESGRLSIEELERMITDFQSTYVGSDGRGLIIIDHIHAFCRGANLTEQLGELSAHLRELAQAYQIPILALSQLNRQPYTDDTGPSNYHLKESGYIADDAYTILLAWRMGANLNVRLTKARNLDLGDIHDPVVALSAAKGKLTDPTLKPWQPHA